MAVAVPFRLLTSVFLVLFGVGLLTIRHCAATNVNNDGNLTLDNVPSDHEYSATGEYDEGGFPLPTTWGLIDSFLHTVSPAPPPYDLINRIIGGTPISITLFTNNISKFAGNLMGFAICFVIGALFCLIFPIVCLCFYCCRCSGNCGGKMKQKQGDYDRMKRVIFGLLLALCLGFIIGGVATAFCVDSFTKKTVETLPTDVTNNIDDVFAFVNNTLKEIDFIASDQLTYTLDQVSQDLTNIEKIVGVPVRQNLAVNVQPAIDAIYPLADSINDTYNALVSVNSNQARVETGWNGVKTLVDQALIDINTACTGCGCCSVSYPDVTGLSMNADWRDIDFGNALGTFPQNFIDPSIQEISTVNDANLAEAADQGKDSFESLPQLLKNTTSAQIDSILSTLNGLNGSISGLLDEITSQVAGITASAEGIKVTVNSFSLLIQQYDPYRSSALIGFYSILLVIALLFLCGLLFGVAGYNSDVAPSQRGRYSNCGGIFMMAGVGVAFLFLTFFMVFTMLLFIVGGPFDRLFCDPVISGELFTETVDKEDAIVPGYFLGQALFQDGNISLTVTGILDDCKNNMAAFDAFKLNNFLNTSDLLNYQQFLSNISSDFDSVLGDLTSIDILTSDAEKILIDFRDSPADTIDWTLFKAELAKDLTNDVNNGNDLSVVAGLLRTFAGTLSDGNVTTFQGLADNLDSIQTTNIAPLLAERDTLSIAITTLESVTGTIDTLVDNTLLAANTAQNYIDDNASPFVSTQIDQYQSRILGYPDQFVKYAEDQLKREIGKCRPIYNLWTSSINILCRGFLESLNALWLIMGWCIFFLLPSTIFGVKLAKHYRRMDYEANSGFDMEMTHGMGSNKVAPSYT